MKFIKILLFLAFIGLLAFAFGFIKGRDETFESFVLEECWITKDGANRDVVCIKQVN